MAIKMIRQPSETPNINNIDDIIPFRYAYGDQNGYVKNKGNELNHTINGSQFIIGSGRVVLQGVESDIDANGFTVNIDSVQETRYYIIYYQVNLALNTTNILTQYDIVTYPTISNGDDLTQLSTGIANLPLYKFVANNGVISNVEKLVQEITYTGTALVDYDNSKGTIEQRLTNLGFRQGSLTLASGITATTNILKRQGNYVIGEITFNSSTLLTASVNHYNFPNIVGIEVGTFPANFKPKTGQTGLSVDASTEVNVSGNFQSGLLGFNIDHAVEASMDSDRLVVNLIVQGNSSLPSNVNANVTLEQPMTMKFGYEANPI